MRYLVTGGTGFIASHLCDALLAHGDSVCVLDNLSTGSYANLPPGVPLVQADIADSSATCAALQDVDGVFRLVAIASVQRGVTDWLGTHRANLTGTITLFDAIRRRGSPLRVVYASSAAGYGDRSAVPISEDTACRPLSAYGADKHACEQHARVAG
jgi:UDP-glucose 4-epimerase